MSEADKSLGNVQPGSDIDLDWVHTTPAPQTANVRSSAPKPKRVVVKTTKKAAAKKPKKPKPNQFDAIRAAQRKKTAAAARKQMNLANFDPTQARAAAGASGGAGGEWTSKSSKKKKDDKKSNPFDAIKAAQRRKTAGAARAELNGTAKRPTQKVKAKTPKPRLSKMGAQKENFNPKAKLDNSQVIRRDLSNVDLANFNVKQLRAPKGAPNGLGGQWVKNPVSVASRIVKHSDVLSSRVKPKAAAPMGRHHSAGLIASIVDASRPSKTDKPSFTPGEARAALEDMERANAEVSKFLNGVRNYTQEQHSVPAKHGEGRIYSEERAKWHDEVVRTLLNDAIANAKEHGSTLEGDETLLLGGLPGAGKTTILDGGKALHGIDRHGYVTINPDDVKEWVAKNAPERLPKIGDLKPLTVTSAFHEEAADIAAQLEREAYRRRFKVAHDYTMSSVKSAQKRIELARAYDYKVRALFVDVPRELSRARAVGRFARGQKSSIGGRPVDLDQYDGALVSKGSRYSSNRDTMDEVVQNGWLDGWQVFDHLQERVEKGGDVK